MYRDNYYSHGDKSIEGIKKRIFELWGYMSKVYLPEVLCEVSLERFSRLFIQRVKPGVFASNVDKPTIS